MAYPTTINYVVDGEPVDAATLNRALSELAARTDHLNSFLSSSPAKLVMLSQTVEAGTISGTPVYFDTALNRFVPAKVGVDTANLNLLTSESVVSGIATNVSGTSADVVVGGTVTLTTLQWAPVFEDGIFATGRVFLSTVDGKLRSTPSSVGVLVGVMRADGTLLVAAPSSEQFAQHVHLRRQLLGKPAGTVIDPTPPSGSMVFDVPNAAERGWLPASPTYFPGYVVGVQIPTGAVFGYNLLHADEADLREIFPFVPASNAFFYRDTVFLDDSVVANEYGIWWMNDDYGRAPWPVNYTASLPTDTSESIEVTTSRLTGNNELVDMLTQQFAAEVASGDYDGVLVRSVSSADASTLSVSASSGAVTLTPRGVNQLAEGRGIGFSGTLVNTSGNYRGVVTAQVNVSQSALFAGFNRVSTYPSGTYAGTATLSGGVVVVNTTAIQSGSSVTMTRTAVSGTPGHLYVSAITNGVSFTVTSSDVGDTSTVAWTIVRDPTVLIEEANPLRPLTTNGSVTGVPVGALGYALGPNAADYLDFVVSAGSDVPESNYRADLLFKVAVDVPSGTVADRYFRIQAYAIPQGGYVIASNLVATIDAVAQTGTPNRLQSVSVSNGALVVQRNRSLLLRVSASPTLPVTAGSLRIASLDYRLIKV